MICAFPCNVKQDLLSNFGAGFETYFNIVADIGYGNYKFVVCFNIFPAYPVSAFKVREERRIRGRKPAIDIDPAAEGTPLSPVSLAQYVLPAAKQQRYVPHR